MCLLEFFRGEGCVCVCVCESLCQTLEGKFGILIRFGGSCHTEGQGGRGHEFGVGRGGGGGVVETKR